MTPTAVWNSADSSAAEISGVLTLMCAPDTPPSIDFACRNCEGDPH